MLNKITERQIVLGCLVSPEYIADIRPIFNLDYLRAESSKRICRWAIEFYDKYNKVIGEDISDLFMEKIDKEHISDELAEQIEAVLQSISDEFEREVFNWEYIADKTEEYFQARALELHQEKVQLLLDNKDIEEANRLMETFVLPHRKNKDGVDLSDPGILDKLEKVFEDTTKPLFKLPGPVGQLVNEFLVRDSFITFQGPEKRGKTWTLLEMAMKAVKQGCNVAFFQAGDMSENQQLRRIAIYRARLSDKEKYTGLQWVPEKDCFYQQIDKCTEPQREYDAGLFSREDGIKSREDITANILKEASLRDPDYRPCRNCPKYHGSVFLKQVDLGDPLTVSDAQREFKKFFIDKKRRFKLQTYPNQTLSVSMIESKLDQWEREDGFVPDVIVIDYMDLLVSNVKEFRHSQNDIWMKIRGLSQKRHTCVISATQADAKSYKTDTMTMDNFSEDKRKYGHVTAMIGLNQDQKGREKELGIMRWNIIVAREAEYIPSKCVSLIQSIKQGRALVSSYW
jgi:hypothetical protein